MNGDRIVGEAESDPSGVAVDISNYGICEFDIFGANGRLKVDLLTNQANYFQVNSNSHDYKILSLEK